MSCLKPLIHLHTLNLADTSITDQGCADLFPYLTELVHLNLFRCDDIRVPGMQSISRLKHLRSLNLDTIGMNDQYLSILCCSMRSLQHLDLFGAQ